jgi:hypothetical protein
MKKIILAIACIFMSACGDGGSSSGGGSVGPQSRCNPNSHDLTSCQWKATKGSIHLVLSFSSSNLTATSYCTKQNLSVSVDTPIVINYNTIQILQSQQNEVRNGNDSCEVHFRQGTYSYSINGSGMLSLEGVKFAPVQ